MDIPAPHLLKIMHILLQRKQQFAAFQGFLERYSISVRDLTVKDLMDIQELDSCRRTMEE